MGKTAIIFSGQGSQKFNMGREFLSIPEFKKVLDDLKEYDETVYDALYVNDDGSLNNTLNAQLAIYATQMGIVKTLESKYNLKFDGTAGFSLGEYTALSVSGLFDYKKGFEILKCRSEEMSKISDGSMIAVLGLNYSELDKVLKDSKLENIFIANYNLERQLVVSGDSSELELITPILKDNGAKRVVPLVVSGAFHTKFFEECGEIFSNRISNIEFNRLEKDVYLNVFATNAKVDNYPEYFSKHMVSGVKWYETVNNMINDGYTTFIECGCSNVVSSMVKKIDRSLEVINIDSVDSIEKMEEKWIKK